MNNPDIEIENTLRRAPRPVPPTGLKETLLANAASEFQKPVQEGGWRRAEDSPPYLAPAARNGWSPIDNRSWLRRWWPALAPAAVSVACAVVLTVQHLEIQDLNQSKAALSAVAPTISADAAPGHSARPVAATSVQPATQDEEIARLSELARQLSDEIARLEQVRNDNAKLRAQIAEVKASTISPDEIEAMKAAQERARSIQCVNNLKQIGLAVRVWALDNQDAFPTNFLCMSNELNTPKILVCPSDTNRMVAPDFRSYTDINCSYDLFAGSDKEPNQVLSRCPIHGNIGLCDGSVQKEIAVKHPDWLVQRDGKLYLENVGGSGQKAVNKSSSQYP